MPKLAIYIPKKDMREIDRWRKKVNFSQIFMTALRKEIRDRSRTVGGSDGQLSKAAEHYRESLDADFGSLIEGGYQLGASDVLDCRLEVQVIRQLLPLSEKEALDGGDVKAVCEAIGDKSRLEKLAQQQGVENRATPTWRELLCRGYAKGVAEAWEQVCQQMQREE